MTGIFVTTEIKNHFGSVEVPSPAGQTKYADPLGLKLILSSLLKRFRTYGAGVGRTILVAFCFFSLKQRDRVMACHGQLHLAANREPRGGRLGDERLHYHHRERHQQHHRHAAHGESVLPAGPVKLI